MDFSAPIFVDVLQNIYDVLLEHEYFPREIKDVIIKKLASLNAPFTLLQTNLQTKLPDSIDGDMFLPY